MWLIDWQYVKKGLKFKVPDSNYSFYNLSRLQVEHHTIVIHFVKISKPSSTSNYVITAVEIRLIHQEFIDCLNVSQLTSIHNM